jgi:hypothetical protein
VGNRARTNGGAAVAAASGAPRVPTTPFPLIPKSLHLEPNPRVARVAVDHGSHRTESQCCSMLSTRFAPSGSPRHAAATLVASTAIRVADRLSSVAPALTNHFGSTQHPIGKATRDYLGKIVGSGKISRAPRSGSLPKLNDWKIAYFAGFRGRRRVHPTTKSEGLSADANACGQTIQAGPHRQRNAIACGDKSAISAPQGQTSPTGNVSLQTDTQN